MFIKLSISYLTQSQRNSSEFTVMLNRSAVCNLLVVSNFQAHNMWHSIKASSDTPLNQQRFGMYTLCTFIQMHLDRMAFERNDSQGNITWSEMGKQNTQAKSVY